MKSIFEELGGTYTLGEDGMYYPNLELPVEEEPHYGKYGRMRMNYIKEHRPGRELVHIMGTSSLFSLESELDRSCFDIPPACRKVRKCRNPNTCETIMNMTVSYWHSSLLRVNYN